jgi:thiamine-phosphate pyrophosphorylase
VREVFGKDFLIGVSTHSIEEARKASSEGADFALFGPVFYTPSKRGFGPAQGLDKLEETARSLSPFPVLAIGGITLENTPQVLSRGASGIAAIRLFDDGDLEALAREIKSGQKL